MKIPKIVTGSDCRVEATWRVGGVITPIPDTATVQFILISTDKQTKHTEVLPTTSAEPGADWPAGVAMLLFPAAATTDITYQGVAAVQMQVDAGAGNRPSGFFTVNIVKGNI